MILEVAEVYIQDGQNDGFEEAIRETVKLYISTIEGYISHKLQRSMEDATRYLLMIEWETLEAHTVNFRQSDVFDKHRALISPFFAKPPFVQHFELVSSTE